MPIIPVLGRLRQENHEFEAILGETLPQKIKEMIFSKAQL
jgi:hypothetical protein